MLTPDLAARMTGLKTRTIYRKIESREVHFIDSPEHELLVCMESLGGVTL